MNPKKLKEITKSEYEIDVDVIEAEVQDLPAPVNEEVAAMSQKDLEFEYARQNIIGMIETSREVVETTAELAVEMEHPRMIEVYSGLIKNLADINKSLIEMRKEREAVTPDEEETVNANITNNNIFVGSTEELLKMMREQRVEGLISK